MRNKIIHIVIRQTYRHTRFMLNFRNLFTLFTLIALTIGVMEIKSFLNQNFIDNDTPIKEALNRFLNGEAS